MIKFPITCVLLVIGAAKYSVLSEEIPYNNPFFKEVADLTCKPEPSNEQLEAIKTNCKPNFEEKPIVSHLLNENFYYFLYLSTDWRT